MSRILRREYVLSVEYLEASSRRRRISAIIASPPGAGGRPSGRWMTRAAAGAQALELRRLLAEALPDAGILVADVR